VIDIAALIPHAGSMCLLDSVATWSEDTITCLATSHLDPANPLRSRGRLAGVCGIEYALQASAVHGALRGGTPQPAGYLASVRLSHLSTAPLDDPALGTLAAHATREHGDAGAQLYTIRLAAEDGRVLLEGRATIILQRL
jgi:predicted hotdog family 3-hydroxylacyl-ACP dehydratase